LSREERFEREALPHWRSLFRTACRLTRSSQDAEDLVQETMLRAYRAFDSYEPDTNIRAWLYTILHHVRHDALRKKGRTPPLVEVQEETAAVAPAQERLAAGGIDLGRAVQELEEPFRTAVVLRDLEELSYDDVARITGAPIGTVMSRIHRGRAALRKRLKGAPA
jgi:RNA polymerase sigma-70 factor (ECF subfamily)